MLEQHGIPTVVMGTFEFEQLAKLDKDRVVILVKTPTGSFNLETIALP